MFKIQIVPTIELRYNLSRDSKHCDKLQANYIAGNKMMKNSKLVYDTTARLDNETINVIDAATREFGAYLSNTKLKRHHFPNSVDDLIA